MSFKNLFIDNFKNHTFNQRAHKRENKTSEIMPKMELYIMTRALTYSTNLNMNTCTTNKESKTLGQMGDL